jgi:hypothetical protein
MSSFSARCNDNSRGQLTHRSSVALRLDVCIPLPRKCIGSIPDPSTRAWVDLLIADHERIDNPTVRLLRCIPSR